MGATPIAQNFRSEELLDSIEEIMGTADEPLADPSVLPTWQLSRLARSKVKVVLSGDGGDELFGGYPTYVAHQWIKPYQRIPLGLRRLMTSVVQQLPVSHQNMSLDFRLKRFLRGAEAPFIERHLLWMGSFGPSERKALWSKQAEPTGISPEHLCQQFAGVGHPDLSAAAMFLDFQSYLVDDLLVKVDRMSMVHGLEVRVPFLDPKLVEFALRLPSRLKVSSAQTKILMRRALRGKVPDSVLGRPKKGFGIPVAKWLSGELNTWARDQLSDKRLAKHGLWNPTMVQRLLEEHTSGQRNHAKLLWTLLTFQMWYHNHS